MPRIRSLIGLVGGLTVTLAGALQQAAAGPVPAILQKPATFTQQAALEAADGKFVLGMFERGPGNALSLPVGGRMSFGFGYQYLTEEDLVFEVAETGSLASGYDSHRIMIRAKLRF